MSKITEEELPKLLKRLLVYVVGLFLIALGAQISKKSNLGVSPVSYLPFVLERKFPISVPLLDKGGFWITLEFSFFVLIQVFLLWKDFKWYYIFQVAVSTLFGVFVSLAGEVVAFIPDVSFFVWQILYTLVSIVIVALGILLYLDGDIMSTSSEGVTLAMSKRFNKPLSTCKLVFDVTVVLIAAVLELILCGNLLTVGIGTAAIAFGVGPVLKPMMKYLKKPIHNWVHGKEEKKEIEC